MPELQSNFIEITLRHGCSPVNLRHIFRTPFTKGASGWLLLGIGGPDGINGPTVLGGVYGAEWRDPVKLDRAREV